jgi:hypothetical protein
MILLTKCWYQRLKLSRLSGIMGLLLIVACTSQEEGTIAYSGLFTSVDVADCRELSAMEMDQHALLRLGQAVFHCPGPAQYSIFLVDDGTRSWYVIDREGSQYSLDKDIVYGKTAGHFPNVGVQDQVEWLLDAQKIPVGIVFSVVYQVDQPDNGRLQSVRRYLAYSLTNPEPVLICHEAVRAKSRQLLTGYLARQ